jgi:hypothetical protein
MSFVKFGISSVDTQNMFLYAQLESQLLALSTGLWCTVSTERLVLTLDVVVFKFMFCRPSFSSPAACGTIFSLGDRGPSKDPGDGRNKPQTSVPN